MKRFIAPFANPITRLRLIEAQDLPLLLAWRNQPEARIRFKNSAPISDSSHEQWFRSYREKDDDFAFMVEHCDQPVGLVSIYDINWKLCEAEIGRFVVSPESAERGYMSSAGSELVAFAFSTLGLNHLWLDVFATNTRAINLYRRIGFSDDSLQDGLIRMSLRKPG